MQMVNLQRMIHVFRNDTSLHLSPHDCFSYLHTGLKTSLADVNVLVLHTKRIKAKNRRVESVTPYCRGSLHPPSNHKKGQRSLASGLRKPCFQTFKKGMGEGTHLGGEKKTRVSSQCETTCTLNNETIVHER